MFKSNVADIQADDSASRHGSLFSGLFITLSNPKVIIMYCGFLPNFMDLGALTHADLLIVCTLVALVIITVMGTYMYLAYKAGGFLSKRSGSILNKSAGVALVATGGYMIFKR
jgi:threonine/homoserine/homoserine lactone efflux protein